MSNGTRVSPRTRRSARRTLAEILRGPAWVARQWEAARGLLKGRAPKDPVAWQRRLRQEWSRRNR